MKKIFTLLIAMLLTRMTFAQVSTWNGSWEPWTHGTGTEADPFLIENAQQLAYLAYRVNNGLDAGGGHVSNHDYHYKLMVDVNLNGSEEFQWTPIGYYNSNTDRQYFGGHFDGNNHSVFGLYNSSAYYVGFFGVVEGATINDFNISESTISSCYTWGVAGGIVGEANGTTTVINCYNNGNVTAGYCGGIVGYACGTTTITNCYNNGGVTSRHQYWSGGGIVGGSVESTIIITSCYNTGSVTAVNNGGGIVGHSCNGSTTTIINCYNTGSVTAVNNGGGIVGDFHNNNNNTSSITNCYNIGSLMANSNCGGIVGYVDVDGYTAVDNSYYLLTCEGNNTYGGEPKTEMFMQSSEFVDILNNGYCAWEYDYNNTNSGYPVLNGIFSSVSAFTKPATNIAATTATLNGSIIVENTNIITKGFEYRIAGISNFTTINVTGNSNDFSYNLMDLTPYTTYEYRAFVNVSDCDITAYGGIETFELTWQNQDTICIYNADMLRWVSEKCNSGTTFEGKCIKLMNDITLPLNVPNNMTSIGVYPNYPFKGTFDGNGKLITNLYIDQPNTPYQGFFGYTLNAYLFNVGLVNITASGRNYTGGMVAYAENTYMRDCYVNGGTLFALSYCGGLVGYQEQGTNSIISGCYNTCEVTGNNYVGGLIGFSNYSTVRNSYVAGRVSAQGEPVGAIIGGANEVLMYYCYFSIELTGQTNAIGWNNIGKDGGEGMTNVQMRDPQFVNTLNQNLATPVWMADYATHINNGFPIIKWQRPGTGVEEHDAAKSYISLYPNPAIDFVTIQSNDSSISLKHIEVYDVTGRKVMSEALDGQNQELNVAKLLSGVYHVRVQASNGCYTNLKLVVQ